MKKLFEKTGLTKQQQIIIGFLLMGLAGGGVLQLTGWKRPPVFDYTDPDREFEKTIKTEFKDIELSLMDSVKKTRLEELKLITEKISNDSVNTQGSVTIPPELKGRKIDLNRSLEADLELLPGIGEVMAERIIDYREKNGPFKDIKELKKVNGIGDKKFEQIRKFIIVE